MSCEEEKNIWGELERDVEREIEEEIKDGICKLALRLHRLYRDQKQRNNINKSADDNRKTLSEVSINIRMEGGTKIEIKEIKKEAARRSRKFSSDIEETTVAPPRRRAQKFDWTKTLRSGGGPSNNNQIDDKNNKAKNKNALIERKKATNMGLINALELGWKP